MASSRLSSRFISHLLKKSLNPNTPLTPTLFPTTTQIPTSHIFKSKHPFTNPHPHPFSRHFSTTSRRNPTRSPKPDIGLKARQMQNKRLWTYALSFSCIAGFIVIVLNQFQDQLVFYVTPSDALSKYLENPSKNKFRLGGLVLEGSVAHPAGTHEIEFVITDLITDMLVRYEGQVPDLFREGHSVVVEGFVKPITDEIKGDGVGESVSGKARSVECYFDASEVLAKHDEKYMPAEVANAIEKNKKMLAEEAEGAKKDVEGVDEEEKEVKEGVAAK